MRSAVAVSRRMRRSSVSRLLIISHEFSGVAILPRTVRIPATLPMRSLLPRTAPAMRSEWPPMYFVAE